MMLRNTIQLICYPNRLGSNLSDLYDVLEAHFSDAVGGVHILAFSIPGLKPARIVVSLR